MDKVAPDEAELERTVAESCLRKNFQLSYLATAGVCFVSVLFAIPAWQLVAHEIVINIVLATFAYQAVMLSISQWYYRQRRYVLSYRHRSIAATSIYAINGVLIAVGCIVYYHYGGMAMFIYVMAIFLGLCEGSLGTAAYHVPAMLAYQLTATPIFLIYLLFTPRSTEVNIVAVGLAFNMMYCIWVGRQQAGNIRTAIRLQHRNDALLSELREQTEIAEDARRVAERSSEEKSRFFASASHDLRQPVHALNIYTSLLGSSKDAEERTDILRRIDGCVRTLSDLFKALLTVARVESYAEQAGPVSPFPLQTAIDNAIALFKPLADEHGVVVHTVKSRCWVQGEQTAIERILGNLLSNAISFSPKGRVPIGVRRRPGRAELQVIDTGIGIGEAEQARIFGEFYQVDNPGRHAEKGFGLGLVIVQRLCTSLGFRVALKSELGRGSCFSVFMPLADPAAPERPAAEPILLPEFDQRIRVLVVDDDPVVRDAMRRILEAWQVTADICASTAECFKLVESSAPAWTCMVLDQRLDEAMTGVQLARALQDQSGRRIPVAIMTGENEGDWVDEARKRGYLVYSKPVKLVRLRAFIVSAFKTGDTAGQSGSPSGI